MAEASQQAMDWLQRFNKVHAPAGSAAGGQFAAASGSSGSKSGKGDKGGKDTRPTPTNQHPVGQGETGKRVSDLQARLNALGAKLKVDGIFGPKTLAAVKAFQKSHGLKVDGLVGPKTTAALRAKHPAAQHTPAHTPAKTPAKTTPAKTAAGGTAKSPRGMEPDGDERVAGAVTNPKGTAQLHEYWVHGEGAAKIKWGAPGDFDRCVMHLGKFIADPKGYCAQAHHDALGIWPATHAKMEKHMADVIAPDLDVSAAPAAPMELTGDGTGYAGDADRPVLRVRPLVPGVVDDARASSSSGSPRARPPTRSATTGPDAGPVRPRHGRRRSATRSLGPIDVARRATATARSLRGAAVRHVVQPGPAAGPEGGRVRGVDADAGHRRRVGRRARPVR